MVTEAPAEKTISFLAGQLSAVDVAKIERELNALWQNSDADSNGGQSVIKSCALNFVLLAGPEEDERALDNLLADITTRHPMRAILALVRDGVEEKSKVEAWVSARCHFLPGRMDKQMCCEQITVKWAGKTFNPKSLYSVITPLVIPDLPSWIFMPGRSLPLASLDSFISYFDHVLVDSRQDSTGADIPDKPRFSELLRLSGKAVIVDLAWLSLKPWRQAFAFAFDEKDVSISTEKLYALKEMKIKYGNRSGLCQGLFLAAWLSEKLGYEFKSARSKTNGKDGFALEYKGKQGALNIKIEPSEGSDLEGIRQVQTSFYNDEEELNIEFCQGALKVHYGETCEYVELAYSQDRCSGKSTELSLCELTDEALEVVRQDKHYLEALSGLLKIEKS